MCYMFFFETIDLDMSISLSTLFSLSKITSELTSRLYRFCWVYRTSSTSSALCVLTQSASVNIWGSNFSMFTKCSSLRLSMLRTPRIKRRVALSLSYESSTCNIFKFLSRPFEVSKRLASWFWTRPRSNSLSSSLKCWVKFYLINFEIKSTNSSLWLARQSRLTS